MSGNFRHYVLSLSLLVGVAVPWAATAQAPISNVGSGSVEDRVTQLERITNAHAQLLTQLQQQIAANQSDIDSLRGQIQENQYQLSQIVDRQKQLYQQIDSLGKGGQDATAAAGADNNNTPTPAGGGDASSAAAPATAASSSRVRARFGIRTPPSDQR